MIRTDAGDGSLPRWDGEDRSFTGFDARSKRVAQLGVTVIPCVPARQTRQRERLAQPGPENSCVLPQSGRLS